MNSTSEVSGSLLSAIHTQRALLAHSNIAMKDRLRSVANNRVTNSDHGSFCLISQKQTNKQTKITKQQQQKP
jgi:hypothetical protein